MAVASYMDFFGYEFEGESTPNKGTLKIDYRIKYNAPIVTAVVEYEAEGDKCNYHISDLGRKHRNSKAEQERVWEIMRVARNYHKMFVQDTEKNASKSFSRH